MYESSNIYASPYQKEETEELIDQVNELRGALALCWSLLPDGDYGADAVSVKQCMTKFQCWPIPPVHKPE